MNGTKASSCNIAIDLREKKTGGDAAHSALDVKYVKTLLQRLPLDVISLSAVVLVILGLLLLPIIYFHTEIVRLIS